MTNTTNTKPTLLDTLRKMLANNVFACDGKHVHVWLGSTLFKSRTGYTCPTCGAEVKDITQTTLGQAFFAIVRPDLWRKS